MSIDDLLLRLASANTSLHSRCGELLLTTGTRLHLLHLSWRLRFLRFSMVIKVSSSGSCRGANTDRPCHVIAPFDHLFPLRLSRRLKRIHDHHLLRLLGCLILHCTILP